MYLRLGCAEEEEVAGRGGDCAPIHIGGIWLENELFLWGFFFFWRGLEKFSSGELDQTGAKHPGEHSECLSRQKLRL